MANFFRSRGVNLDSIFQPYSSANATQAATLSSSITRYRNSNVDINTKYAGRDNRSQNAVSLETLYRVNGVDLLNFFNKINSDFVLQISGTFTYDKTSKTPGLSYSPTNVVVPNLGTRINAGTYSASTTNTSNTVLVGTNVPASYIVNRSGTMIINTRPVTFAFGGNVSFTGNPYNVTDFISIGGLGLPSGVTYSVSPSTATAVGTYDNTLYTITIVGDSASNYSVTKTGSFQISGLGIDVFISGERLYNGFCLTPQAGLGEIATSPPGYETSVGFFSCVTNPGLYDNNSLQAYSANPNVTINGVFGSFKIYTTLLVTVSFPGTAMYTQAEYKPSTSSVTSLQGAPVPGSLVNDIIPLGTRIVPGTYSGADFTPYIGYTDIYREGSYSGGMTISNFIGTIDLTQTVNSNGIGNVISLVSIGSISPSLPGGVSYAISTFITDTGIGYPQYVSATNGNCSYSIIGDNGSYYTLTITGTITILAPPN